MISRPLSLQTVDSRHFKILAKTPSKFVEVGPSVPIDTIVKKEQKENNRMEDVEPIESIPAPNIFQADSDMQQEEGEPDVIIHCKSCGIQCRREYYHCAKIPSYNVCQSCFCEGRFLMSLYSADFVKLDLQQSTSGKDANGSAPWTDQEVLYLLEGLEMYGAEDWDAVAKHVGSTRRSREDCIAKFLELPIQEKFTSSLLSNSKQLNPLLSAENPVMAIVSFLASMVHPNVAAAAAQAAISAYSQKELAAKNGDTPAGGESIYNKAQLESVAELLLEDAGHKARELVAEQDEKITHTLTLLFEVYYKKMELKMQQVSALEETLRQDQIDLEKQKQQIVEQKTQIMDQKMQLLKHAQEMAALQQASAIKATASTGSEPSSRLSHSVSVSAAASTDSLAETAMDVVIVDDNHQGTTMMME